MTAPATRLPGSRWVGAWHAVLVVAGLVALTGLVWHNMDLLGDTFWYIASGRVLLERRGVPRVDLFSYASMKDRWIVGMPGACVLFALVSDHLGLRALTALGTGGEVAAAATLWLGAARTSLGRLVLLPFALFFVYVGVDDLSVRGQVFGDLAFVLLLVALVRLRDGERVQPALFVVGASLWANFHYSFLLMFFVPPGVAALLLLEPRATRPPLRPFLTIPPLALVGALVNPYGWRYLAFTFHMMFSPLNDDLLYWRSPELHEPYWLLALVAGVAVVLVRGAYGAPRCRLPEQALVVVFLGAACNARRWETLLVAVEMGVLGPILDEAAAALRDRFARALSPAVAAASVASAAAGLLWGRTSPDPLANVPVAGAEVARAAARARVAAGRAMDRVVDPLHLGGYLAYAWMGDPMYFHDGRDQMVLFANGVYEDERALWNGTGEYAELLDTYEAGVVLWERGRPLDVQLRQDRGWELAYEDRFFAVHVRKH